MPCVVDASVVLKWYLDEPHAQAARRLLAGDDRLVVPDLLFAEVGNALWKRWRRKDLAPADVAAILAALGSVPFDVRAIQHLAPGAVDIAIETGCTVYDGLYMALARDEGLPFVTADAKLHRLVMQRPIASVIRWVEAPI